MDTSDLCLIREMLSPFATSAEAEARAAGVPEARIRELGFLELRREVRNLRREVEKLRMRTT